MNTTFYGKCDIINWILPILFFCIRLHLQRLFRPSFGGAFFIAKQFWINRNSLNPTRNGYSNVKPAYINGELCEKATVVLL